MTNQEIFDTVFEKLLKQGCASMNVHGECMYRGQDDAKCAVGHLIPDELYDTYIERRRVEDLPDIILNAIIDASSNHEHPKSNLNLLIKLQGAHDRYLAHDGINDWKERMRVIAIEFGLTFKGN